MVVLLNVMKSGKPPYTPWCRSIWFIVALFLLLAEFSVLFFVKNYHPYGFVPVTFATSDSPLLADPETTTWVDYPEPVLEKLLEATEPVASGFDRLDQAEKASVLRDWARLALPEFGPDLDTEDPLKILEHSDLGANCKPRAALYCAVLSSWGIPARRVAMFVEAGKFDRVHSSVEIWTGEKWIIEDPTFNSAPADSSGRHLGAVEIQEIYANGGEITWVQDKTHTEPNFESYAVSPNDLSRVLIIHRKSYPLNTPKLMLWGMKFIDRITGDYYSILITRDKFPVPVFIMNGTVDRIILTGFILSLLAAFYPYRPRSDNASSTATDSSTTLSHKLSGTR